MQDSRTICHNILCPICQAHPVKKQNWGEDGFGGIAQLLTCTDPNCPLWYLVSEKQFENYNYFDRIDNYFIVQERKWTR